LTRKKSKEIKKITRTVNYVHNKRIGFLFFLIAFVICYMMIIGLITPVSYDFVVGDLADQTIVASEDVIDEMTTLSLRNNAADQISPIYVIDESIKESSAQKINLFFTQLNNARLYAVETYIKIENELRKKNDQITSLDQSADAIDWSSYLSTNDKKLMSSLASLEYQSEQAEMIASLDEAELLECAEKLDQIIKASFEEETLLTDESFQNAIIERLTINYTFSSNILLFARTAIKRDVQSYYIYDDNATQKRIADARNAVNPVIYKSGQNIVTKGEVVTEAQFLMLSKLNIASSPGISRQRYISLFVYLLILFIGFYIYLAEFEVELFKNANNTIILSTITVIAIVVAGLTERYQPNLLLVLFGTMMTAILLGQRIGISFNLFFSLVFFGITSWNLGTLAFIDYEPIIFVIIGGIAGVLLLKNVTGRSQLLVAGLFSGLIGAIVIFCFSFLKTIEMHTMIIQSLWFIIGGLLSGIIALGLLPLWETLFRVATPTKLLELLNTNNKVLQRLVKEAPGTYYHSVMVANLCENAANGLKANALLVKTAALYHDIGKLQSPEYFTENQTGYNPHDDLTMVESARRIIGHVADGVHLAKINKLPKEVIEIMSQHHGDALLPNFYFKQKEINPSVSEIDFRYPFKKPTTKEAGILMIADTVEAAMRSQKDLPYEQKLNRITSLIVEKFNHGLLDNCPLTRKDLGLMANIFTITLEKAQHNRIKYAYNLEGKKQED